MKHFRIKESRQGKENTNASISTTVDAKAFGAFKVNGGRVDTLYSKHHCAQMQVSLTP